MPGFNGTGPMGQGARTGWGRGYCNQANTADANQNIRGGAGSYGYGLGMRRGFGGGGFGRGCRGLGGRGFGFGCGYGAGQYAYNVNADDELAVLKQRAEAAKNSLDSISKRVAELEKSKE